MFSLFVIFNLYILIGINIFFGINHFRLFNINSNSKWFWSKNTLFWMIPTFLWPFALILGLWYFMIQEWKYYNGT